MEDQQRQKETREERSNSGSVGKHTFVIPQAILRKLLLQTFYKLPEFSPQQLASLAWGLASL